MSFPCDQCPQPHLLQLCDFASLICASKHCFVKVLMCFERAHNACFNSQSLCSLYGVDDDPAHVHHFFCAAVLIIGLSIFFWMGLLHCKLCLAPPVFFAIFTQNVRIIFLISNNGCATNFQKDHLQTSLLALFCFLSQLTRLDSPSTSQAFQNVV